MSEEIKMSELKPCPFCGSSAELIIKDQNWDRDYFEGEIAVVRCSNHECHVAPESHSEEARGLNSNADSGEAIKIWNTRAVYGRLTTITKQRDELINGVESLLYKLKRAHLNNYEHDAIDCIKDTLSTIKEQKDEHTK